MDIRQLQYFLALTRQEHISNTAEFLNISQPALSKSISSLEKEIGVPLFNRYHNRITLNDYGREFAVYAQTALESLDAGLAYVRQTQYDIRGEIRITCHAFADILSDCLDQYMKLNPHIRLQLYQSQIGDTHLSDKADFLLGTHMDAQLMQHQAENDCGWVPQPLTTEEVRVLISPRYRVYPADVSQLPFRALKEDLFITDELKPTFFYENILYRLANQAGFTPRILCQTDDFLTKIHLLDTGKAITLLPASCLRTVRKLSPDIQDFGIQGYDTSRTLYLLRKRRSLLSEAALDFWEFAMDFYSLSDDSTP